MSHLGDLSERVAAFQGNLWIVFDERYDGRILTRFDRTDFARMDAFLKSVSNLQAQGPEHFEGNRIGPCRVQVSTFVHIEFGYAVDDTGMLHVATVKLDWIDKMEPVLKQALIHVRKQPNIEIMFALEKGAIVERGPQELVDWLKSKKR